MVGSASAPAGSAKSLKRNIKKLRKTRKKRKTRIMNFSNPREIAQLREEIGALRELIATLQASTEVLKADNLQLRRYVCQDDVHAEFDDPTCVGDVMHHEITMMLQALDSGLGDTSTLHDRYLEHFPPSEWDTIRAWRAAAAFLEDEIKASKSRLFVGLSTEGASQTTIDLCRMLLERDRLGQEKYGVSMDRQDLTPSEWDMHHLQELLDAAGYTLRSYQKRKGLEAKVSAFLRKWGTPDCTLDESQEAVDELRKEYEAV